MLWLNSFLRLSREFAVGAIKSTPETWEIHFSIGFSFLLYLISVIIIQRVYHDYLELPKAPKLGFSFLNILSKFAVYCQTIVGATKSTSETWKQLFQDWF